MTLAREPLAETAGEHLVHRVPRARPQDRADAVRAGLAGQIFDCADLVCVVDAGGRLVGVLRLTALFRADPDRPVGDIMERQPPCCAPATDQEKVAGLALRHGIAAVPVVDADGSLLGVVPPEALIEVLRREHIEDLHRLVGIEREGAQARRALREPPARRVRHRLPWLGVGLAGSMLATAVVAQFEQALAQRVAIAFFIPAIVYLADAIGTQTEAIAVRGLSTAHMPLHHLLAGELGAGVLIGLALSAVAFPAAWLAFGDLRLALAVAATITVAGAVATTVGLLLPWLLSRLGQDPAFGSGPVATVIQDVLSLLTYFGIVWLLLL